VRRTPKINIDLGSNVLLNCIPAAIQANRTGIPNVIGLKAGKLLSLRVVINALILRSMPILIAL
jgi:hypothetical protein